jgi:hypothetical protein
MKNRIDVKVMSILLTMLATLTFIDGHLSQAIACDYYASPNGGGSGLSQSSPFRIANFWKVAAPGKTLCLLGGVYSDSISPPQNLNGTASARITIKALNDGGVRINGGAVRTPIKLQNNDYFLIEGVNAHNGSCSVVQIGTGADHNILRRVVAWDAKVDANCIVISNNNNSGNLFEDVAGFGTGRKIFQNYTATNFTIRRAWGRWEKSTIVGPKMVISLAYNSKHALGENIIGTWDETAMGGVSINQPTAILGTGHIAMDPCANVKFFGSIAYIRASDALEKIVGLAKANNAAACYTFQDTFIYIEPGSHTNLKPFSLQNDPYGVDKFITNTTAIGGSQSTIESQWQVSNRWSLTTMNTGASLLNGSSGARVCKRYVNGNLTDQPLWPWPMNQRIIDAMKTAGKAPVDVTKTMEEIFGPIPSECRSSSSTYSDSSALTAPMSLGVEVKP